MLAQAETLIGRAVQGDADALSELLYQYGPATERSLWISKAWRAVLEPADVMQVTYLEAFLEIRRFDPQRAAAFPTWLRRIADNNLRDAIRGLERQKRPPAAQRAELPADGDSLRGLCELLAATTTSPSQVAAHGEWQAALQNAIAALPPDYATVVRRYDLAGRSIAEVAGELGRSPGAVHMLCARAHERLREWLGAESMFFSSGA